MDHSLCDICLDLSSARSGEEASTQSVFAIMWTNTNTIFISFRPRSMGTPANHGFVRRTANNVASGTVAGIAVCLVGHPFDTLKVRLQTQPVHSPVYSGLVDCFVKTLKWEGIGGLYKGVGTYTCTHIPSLVFTGLIRYPTTGRGWPRSPVGLCRLTLDHGSITN